MCTGNSLIDVAEANKTSHYVSCELLNNCISKSFKNLKMSTDIASL